MEFQDDTPTTFDTAAEHAIAVGNTLLDENQAADPWEVASGLLAGAVQFWLFSRQPCDDPFCEACADISNAARRLQKLVAETRELAEESDYYDSPNDIHAGNA
jgi:hypothetical protein